MTAVNNPIATLSSERAIELWHASRMSVTAAYEMNPEILRINGSVVGTLGNFSASIGKAKSKKTFNASAIVASALTNDLVLSYVASLPANKRRVLYIDTEQSPYHCQKVMKRILRMCGFPDDRDCENLEFLALRKFTPEERIEITRQAIYGLNDIGLVIIDGIRDFVHDINSPSESTSIVSLLMKWTDERQIHIHVIIHQNKSDENARGHIGTELNNKAETVISVEKDSADPSVSKVKPVFIRSTEFEPFAFRIDEYGLPQSTACNESSSSGSGRKKFDPYFDISEAVHRAALTAAFAHGGDFKYHELEVRLKDCYARQGVELSNNKLAAVIKMLRNKQMIVQPAGSKKYRFNESFIY